MKHKGLSRVLCLLLALVLLLGLTPAGAVTAFAAGGVAADSKWGANGKLLFTVDEDGVLTWSEVPGATGYDVTIWVGNGLFKSETGLTTPRYELEAALDQYKKDSGTVQIIVNSKGEGVYGDSVYLMYSSPYPKLEAPANLSWNDMVADWDDVPGADGYVIYLYQSSGSAFSHWEPADSYFNFTDIPAAANALRDGWFFKVQATSTGDYRSSEFNESGRRGGASGGGIAADSKWGTAGKLLFTVDEDGVLTWSEVPGATGYDVTIWTDNGLFKSETDLAASRYELEAVLNQYRKDSGTVQINVNPKGENLYSYADEAYFLYSSPYPKLEAPTNLSWNDNAADWNDVSGADGYVIYLYQDSGSAYSHWTTTESNFDFSGVAEPGEDWYFTVQATSSTGYIRDSAVNESPRKTATVSTTLFQIGAYVYDESLEAEDSGGEVSMTTPFEEYDWSGTGYTDVTLEDTTVEVKARPAPGYKFVEWRQGTQGATISTDAEYSFTCTGHRYLYAIFRQVLGSVELTVTAPKEGGTPSYTVGCGSETYYAVGGSGNYTDYRKWYMSSDGSDWQEIDASHRFQSGYHYKFVTEILAIEKAEFDVYDNGGAIQPNVSATVNGYAATVTKTYGQEPSRHITVEYNFGECNDSVVENIIVGSVTSPVAGERPTYTYSISGSGYRMNTSKNAYYDDWQNDRKLYYIKNGIGWFDMTEFDWVYENETFIPGHEYQANVYLVTEDGYEFAHTKYYEPTVTATVNGNSAEAATNGSDCVWSQQIRYTFSCTQKEISTVMLYDLDAPRAGKTPDYSPVLAYPEVYQLDASYGTNGIIWYDCEDNPLSPTDTFRQGEQYKLEIKLIPAQSGGVNVCRFVSPAAAYINGEQVSERLNWDNVYASSNAMYVYYTFIKGASAPIGGVSVSGQVVSFNDEAGAITLQLFKENSNTPAYETTVKGNTVNYSFPAVAPGSYTLRVSKADHVTRDYAVTVSGAPVTRDVKIHLLGDISGDGRANAVDKKFIYNHMNDAAKTLTGYEFDVANVNGDTRVNAIDKKMIYNHMNDAAKALW